MYWSTLHLSICCRPINRWLFHESPCSSCVVVARASLARCASCFARPSDSHPLRMLSRTTPSPTFLTRTFASMTTTSLTHRSSVSPPPAAKRQRTALGEQPAAAELKPAAAAAAAAGPTAVAGPSSHVDYRNKAFLAPMVRSGTCTSRRRPGRLAVMKLTETYPSLTVPAVRLPPTPRPFPGPASADSPSPRFLLRCRGSSLSSTVPTLSGGPKLLTGPSSAATGPSTVSLLAPPLPWRLACTRELTFELVE